MPELRLTVNGREHRLDASIGTSLAHVLRERLGLIGTKIACNEGHCGACTVQVDGTLGSAVAGLRDCWIQPYGATPRPVWNPDVESPIDHYGSWQKLPEQRTPKNAFRAQWELFLRHVVLEEPFPWSLFEGAKGVQLAELGLESSRRRSWVELPDLEA